MKDETVLLIIKDGQQKPSPSLELTTYIYGKNECFKSAQKKKISPLTRSMAATCRAPAVDVTSVSLHISLDDVVL